MGPEAVACKHEAKPAHGSRVSMRLQWELFGFCSLSSSQRRWNFERTKTSREAGFCNHLHGVGDLFGEAQDEIHQLFDIGVGNAR